MFAYKVTLHVAAGNHHDHDDCSIFNNTLFKSCQETVRCVNITKVQNKHLFVMLVRAAFERLAVGQRVTNMECFSCLIEKQTDCLSQQTEKKKRSPHLAVYL